MAYIDSITNRVKVKCKARNGQDAFFYITKPVKGKLSLTMPTMNGMVFEVYADEKELIDGLSLLLPAPEARHGKKDKK